MARNKVFYDKLIELATVTSKAAPIQMIILILGFCSGLVIIHFLSPEHYALYTIAYTIISMIATVSEGGIGSAVKAEGGKVWKDPHSLGRVVATGLHIRRQISFVALLVSLPVMAGFLAHHGANWKEIILLTLTVLPIVYLQLTSSLLNCVPALHQRVMAMQRISATSATLRFLLILLAVVTLPYTALVLAATGISSAYQLIKTRALASTLCDLKSEADAQLKPQMYGVTKRVMPNAIYTCFSTTLSIWLISIFGSTESVAEVGALDRIARILLVAMTLFSLIIEPRFARLETANPSLIRTRFLQVYSFCWVLGVLIALGIYLFPEPLVYLLGNQYQHLTHEIQLRGIVMGLAFVANTTSALAMARAWVVPPIPLISGQVISQIIAVMVLDCSTTAGVILIPIFPFSVLIVMRTYYTLYSIDKLYKENQLG